MHFLDTTLTSYNNLSASHVLQKSSSYSKSGSNVNRSLFTDDDNNINFEKKSSKNLGNYYNKYTFVLFLNKLT